MTKDRRSPVGWLLDHPWAVVVAAISVWFCLWIAGTRKTDHQVQASFASAFNLVPGLAISVDGLEVGKIGKVKYSGGKALVTIGINDKRFWPLHQGTKVISRWGTTIGSGTRRLDIEPGPATNPAIKQGGIIPTADTQPAVDVDLVLNTLNGKVRSSLTGWQKGMAGSFKEKQRDLGSALARSDDGVGAASDVLGDLATDTFALRALVRNGQRTTSTLASRDGNVRDLVTVAARTLQTFASNTKGTQDSIAELPGTLAQARSSLRRVDRSIDNLDGLVTALAPGAKALRPLAAAARPAFADLRQIVPSAVSTLRVGTSAAPKVTDLLRTASPFAQRSASVFTDLAPMVSCVRPYAPELGGAIVGLATSHQTYDLKNGPYIGADSALDPNSPPQFGGRIQHVNGQDKIIQYGLRAQPQVSTSSVELPFDSALTVSTGLKKYAFPRPPGYSAGQTMFMPECGITKDALDATKDPESPTNQAKYKAAGK
jgi:ABC-type transporter Mla subunit MlaD